jgi:hypothetical protein
MPLRNTPAPSFELPPTVAPTGSPPPSQRILPLPPEPAVPPTGPSAPAGGWAKLLSKISEVKHSREVLFAAWAMALLSAICQMYLIAIPLTGVAAYLLYQHVLALGVAAQTAVISSLAAIGAVVIEYSWWATATFITLATITSTIALLLHRVSGEAPPLATPAVEAVSSNTAAPGTPPTGTTSFGSFSPEQIGFSRGIMRDEWPSRGPGAEGSAAAPEGNRQVAPISNALNQFAEGAGQSLRPMSATFAQQTRWPPAVGSPARPQPQSLASKVWGEMPASSNAAESQGGETG